MKFSKLRVVGFKTFVEPTDFVIEAGLTGVVGPNGCGKSNLVEALRWVMGENSHKNMRAAGMDEVIFSGNNERPARNTAEVGLVLDNADRTAPAGFNDADVLEITRRIEREAGSTYRINGREVRARDVQILFADASTGARSPAMVRQGQIGEIIAARPQARRRILEEAAGIAGLHSRRHEADLRLKAADDNLARVAEVLKQIVAQADGLKRQARQSARYRAIAADIRRAEALLHLVVHRDVAAQLAEAQRRLELDTRTVGECTVAQVETTRLAAIAADALPALRDAEAAAAAALQRLTLARDALDAEERRVGERAGDLDRRIGEATHTLARETSLIEDADAMLARLAGEDRTLAEETAFAAAVDSAARLRLRGAQEALARSETSLRSAETALADVTARRGAFSHTVAEEGRRLARIDAERATLAAEQDALRAAGGGEAYTSLSAAFAAAVEAAAAADILVQEAERRQAEARSRESATRPPLAEAQAAAQRIDTEAATLRKLLDAGGGAWPPVVDALSVAKGYELALGAAFGDDLDASLDAAAPAHWGEPRLAGPAAGLPTGATPLADFVEAPPALRVSLQHVGVVERVAGETLRAQLSPGQRLVSKEGDLWRWDGFSAAADAPTPAARRLAERNRLGDLAVAAAAAQQTLAARRAEADAATAALRHAGAAEGEARQQQRAAVRAVEEARQRLAAAEREQARTSARVGALDDALARLTADRVQTEQRRLAAAAALDGLQASPELTAALDAARATAAQDRVAVAEANAAAQGLGREAETRRRRRQTIATESASWADRLARARAAIEAARERLAQAETERAGLDEAPARLKAQRRALLAHIETAETACRQATDRRGEGEAQAAHSDRAARAALAAMAQAREDRARTEERVVALRQRADEIVRAIDADLGCAPAGLAQLAGVAHGAELQPVAESEHALARLRQERDRLGAVNLRADEELAEVEQTRDRLSTEHDDLTEAVKRLRQGIQNLNRDGRERLLAAFSVVNGHFKELFTSLFGGGAAELQLVESDDPLEAGLEILARPPGKKPATMTLLSGGEQALTALSLIFAVFLTNPSPICVLDEVDAPLDDANVERFCDLLDEMAKRTDTRFMTITHNPITMARMDRLFGVTMAERGVSQLLSVDLQTAESFREAS